MIHIEVPYTQQCKITLYNWKTFQKFAAEKYAFKGENKNTSRRNLNILNRPSDGVKKFSDI